MDYKENYKNLLAELETLGGSIGTLRGVSNFYSLANEAKVRKEIKRLKSINKVQLIDNNVETKKLSPTQSVPAELTEQSLLSATSKLISDFPPELHGVYLERKHVFLSACSLKMQLNAVPMEDENQALSLQQKIVQLFERMDDCTTILEWCELNEWQREEICHLLFQDENFDRNYLKMLQVLFVGRNTPQNKIRVTQLFLQVPVSTLAPYGDFLHKTTDLYDFPDISEALKTPAIRLNDCTIKQFSFADAIYYKVATNNWNDLYMRQLVASLYCLSGKEFDVVDLPKVAEITDKISAKKRARIVFAYLSVRSYIIAKYPKIFSTKNVSEDENQPVFRSKTNKYTPFSKVISTMVFDEKQPLGNLHDCNRTRIYDFFDIFQEAISR